MESFFSPSLDSNTLREREREVREVLTRRGKRVLTLGSGIGELSPSC